MPGNYTEIRPAAALAEFVECYWVKRGSSPAIDVLADGCVDFLFDCGDAPQARVIGAMTAPHAVSACARSDIVAVRFRPRGAYPFVRADLAELTDGAVAFDDLAASHRWLRDRVFDAAAVGPRLRAIEAWLLANLPRRGDAIDAALTILERRGGAVRIDELAGEVGVSRQWLCRGIRERAGLSPKLLARILRLRAIERVAASGSGLAELAQRFGYCDQAHLARDVRAIHRRTTRTWLGFHSSKTEPAAAGTISA
ncbi:MAG: helix-turn-helix transcriptional regulator [Planctomycetes bacterium]|nr:helix-turn-helix transcriptional regulator [Planctomycetota bacterium]